jgi:hypothetical protein
LSRKRPETCSSVLAELVTRRRLVTSSGPKNSVTIRSSH